MALNSYEAAAGGSGPISLQDSHHGLVHVLHLGGRIKTSRHLKQC